MHFKNLPIFAYSLFLPFFLSLLLNLSPFLGKLLFVSQGHVSHLVQYLLCVLSDYECLVLHVLFEVLFGVCNGHYFVLKPRYFEVRVSLSCLFGIRCFLNFTSVKDVERIDRLLVGEHKVTLFHFCLFVGKKALLKEFLNCSFLCNLLMLSLCYFMNFVFDV